MMKLTFREVVFSVNTFAAAMLALAIAFSLDFERPFWAMLSVYITSQPLSGAVRSKALYRLLGTLLGLAAALVLVPNFVNSPILLVVILASWIGLCLYLSLLDRTPRAYVFMLAGYTAGLIGFPSVTDPAALFDTAIARVEEISLGVICASLMHSLFFPRPVIPAIQGKITVVLSETETWIKDMLSGMPIPELEHKRRRVAADLTELHVLATHLPYDTSVTRHVSQEIQALQDRLIVLLPVVDMVADRLAMLTAAAALTPQLSVLADDVRQWMEGSSLAMPEQAAALILRCQALEPAPDSDTDWDQALQLSLCARLAELIEAVQDCRVLASCVADPGQRAAARVEALAQAARSRALHLDHGLAALSGFAAIVAVVACSLIWIYAAWPDGYVAAMMAGVFCSLFATMDDPTPALRGMLRYITLGMPIAAIYLFAIFPMIDGFPMLALVLAPVLLWGGALMAMPANYGKALALMIGTISGMALTPNFHEDFPGFANTNLAMVVGIVVALTVTYLFRVMGAELSVQRLLRFGWRDLAAVATRRTPLSRAVWGSRMLDRVGLLLPRLAIVKPHAVLATDEPLRDLRIGLGVIDLRALRKKLGGEAGAAIDRLLFGIADYFRALSRGRIEAPLTSLLNDIDIAITDIMRLELKADRRAGLLALVGLRRLLFPAVNGYAVVGGQA
jgi:uncharacterized membrane protein YccC